MKRKVFLFTSTALFILINLFLPTEEAHFVWERLPIFNVIFGFLGCILIIVVSKTIGKCLQRDENYYD
jgi:hypothetical protein